MAIDSNKATTRRLYEEVAGANALYLLDDIVSPEIVDHSANFQGGPSALDDFRRHVASLHETFDELEIAVDELIAEGDIVIAFWTLSGVQNNPLWGVPPTGKRVRTQTVTRLRFLDGRLVEYHSRPDRLDLLAQLGSLGVFAEQFS